MKKFLLFAFLTSSVSAVLAQVQGDGTESFPYYLSGDLNTHAVIDKNGIWTIGNGLGSITTETGTYTLGGFRVSNPDTNGYVFDSNAESLTITDGTARMNNGIVDFGPTTHFKNAYLEVDTCSTIYGDAIFSGGPYYFRIQNGPTMLNANVSFLGIENTNYTYALSLYTDVTLTKNYNISFYSGRALYMENGTFTVHGDLTFYNGSSATIWSTLKLLGTSYVLRNLSATHSSVIEANNLAVIGTNSINGSLTVNGTLTLSGATSFENAVKFGSTNPAMIELKGTDVKLYRAFVDSTGASAHLKALADTPNSLDLSSSTHYKFSGLTLESGASLSLYMDYNTTVEIEGAIYLDSKSSLKIYGFQEHMIQVEEELFDGNLSSIQALDSNGNKLGNVSIIGGYLSLATVPEPAQWATIFAIIALSFVAYRKRK